MPALAVAYLYLAGAIGLEVIGTTMLQKSEQFTRPLPTIAMAAAYIVSMYCLSHTLRVVPLGIAYAMWGGLGIILTTVVGLTLFGQKLDLWGVVGITLILAGTVVINLMSQTLSHG